MDIELLSRMIGELVLDNEKVGLPGLGSFVAENVGASFSDRGYTINPPYRRLVFSSEETGDRLLAEMYAGANDLSVMDSEKILTDFVASVKKDLDDSHAVVFPGLGRLRSTSRGQVFFVCDDGLDLFPDGIMLPVLSLKNHSDEEILGRAGQPSDETLAEIARLQPEPASEPEPVAETLAEPVAEPDSVGLDPEPAAGLESESGDESGEEQAEEVVSDTDDATELWNPARDENADSESAGSIKYFRWWVALIVLVSLVILAFVIFVILCNVAPDFVDHLLYTDEELKIIYF